MFDDAWFLIVTNRPTLILLISLRTRVFLRFCQSLDRLVQDHFTTVTTVSAGAGTVA